MISIELILFITGILLLISILASKASALLGVPALILFILIGMLAGSEGPGGIYFDNPWLTQFLGVIALAFILFSGGLDTRYEDIRPILWSGLSLATFGVLITAVATGLFVHLILDLELLEAVMLGAIVGSTDAAAVFATMRSGGVRLRHRIERLLEFESGSNDPMAIFLTLALIQLASNPETPVIQLVPMFIQQLILGGVGGYVMGRAMAWVINRTRLTYEGLYPVLTISLVLIFYAATTLIGGSGFLAVYIGGLELARRDFIHKKSLMRFHDGLGWLMQITMFLVLGLLVFPSELIEDPIPKILIALFLIVVARPVSVMIMLLFSKFNLRERILISWVGLRGATPIILGTFPLLAGVPHADIIFNIVFFVVLSSVAIQGPLIVPLARWLGLENPDKQPPKFPLEYESSLAIGNQLTEITVTPDSAIVGQQIVNLHLPENVLILLIGRGDNFITPRGSTHLKAKDRLLVLADKDAADYLNTLIEPEKQL